LGANCKGFRLGFLASDRNLQELQSKRLSGWFMALEFFGKLDGDGDVEQKDHIFTGRKQDLINMSKWLNDGYSLNRRKKKTQVLSKMFVDGANMDIPFVRLNKKETRDFHEALTALSENKRSKPLRDLVEAFNVSLCVY
jgi:hypothetical protein